MNTTALATDRSDDILVTRARAGERDALAALYGRHGRAVYSLALRLTANHASAEDVVQETFLRAAQGLATFRGDAPVAAWLKRLAANAAIDHLRKQRRMAADDEIEALAADAVDLGAAMDAVGLLQRLAPAARSVLLLHEMEGYSHPEIAVMFGKTQSWSKSMLARTVARMHVWLQEET
jgi:RNA polymerase sigma-70 factor (ECF subfamily)